MEIGKKNVCLGNAMSKTNPNFLSTSPLRKSKNTEQGKEDNIFALE